MEAVRTGFQQPSGPGAEVGTAQSRHGGSRQAGRGGGGTRRVLTPNQMEGGSHSGSWFCDERAPWIEALKAVSL